MKILILLFTFSAFSQTLIQTKSNSFKVLKREFEIKELFEDYAGIKKINLILPTSLKGRVNIYGKKVIKKEEIDLYLSAVASEVGYTILKNKELNQLEVISARDIRYKPTKIYKDIKLVPNDYSHVKYIVPLKHTPASQFSRNMRPFLSRYGRIIDIVSSNTVILSDMGKNIHRAYNILKSLDKPEYTKREVIIDKINKENTEIIIEKESILDVIKDQHVLFLITFLLLGGIIGFGISTALNKRNMEW